MDYNLGACPSSGTATSKWKAALKNVLALEPSEFAAPEAG